MGSKKTNETKAVQRVIDALRAGAVLFVSPSNELCGPGPHDLIRPREATLDRVWEILGDELERGEVATCWRIRR